MTENRDDRALILKNIRKSLGKSVPATAIVDDYKSIPRDYKRIITSDSTSRMSLFAERIEEYGSGVYRTTESAIAASITTILNSKAKKGLVIPTGLPSAWLPQELAFTEATGYDAYDLDVVEGVLTGCKLAIADTGTIVLQNATAQGARMLSLVPDYHLCVIFAAQIVGTVPEAFDLLERTSSLPTTFISGPSATADIEMTRIKGVHGPRFLDVLIVS